MRRKKRRFHVLNPTEILDVLVNAGKTTWAEITKLAEIDDLERRLKALRGEVHAQFAGLQGTERRRWPLRAVGIDDGPLTMNFWMVA